MTPVFLLIITMRHHSQYMSLFLSSAAPCWLAWTALYSLAVCVFLPEVPAAAASAITITVGSHWLTVTVNASIADYCHDSSVSALPVKYCLFLISACAFCCCCCCRCRVQSLHGEICRFAGFEGSTQTDLLWSRVLAVETAVHADRRSSLQQFCGMGV